MKSTRRSLLAYGAGALGVAAAGPGQAATREGSPVTIIFVAFYQRVVKLDVDGRTLFWGMLDTEDKTTDISATLSTTLGGRRTIRLTSGSFDQTYTHDFTPAEKWLVIHGGANAHAPLTFEPTSTQPGFD